MFSEEQKIFFPAHWKQSNLFVHHVDSVEHLVLCLLSLKVKLCYFKEII